MLILLAGMVIFIGIHIVPWFPDTRQRLAERYGEMGYKGRFSVIAFAGLGLIIYGKAVADFVPLWQPPTWGSHVTVAIMLPALILFPAADMPGHIRRILRHPMLIGILLWSGAHLLANGDMASALLFGGFFVYALLDLISVNRRNKVKGSKPPQLKFDVIAAVAGIILYVLLIKFHAVLFRMPVIL